MSADTGKISVIVPCYNSARYLRQALESLLWQTYPHWECILIDDGSTDQSKVIYSSYLQRDNRFKYIYQPNSGPSVARNRGIDAACGEFIQFLDADDILLKDRFQKCIAVFQTHENCDIVYTEYMTYNKTHGFSRNGPAKFPCENIFKAMLLEHNRTFVATIHEFLFRKEIITTNKFDESLPIYCEDVECWIRIAKSGATFAYLDDILAIYRFAGESLSSQEVNVHSAKLLILEKYRSHPLMQQNKSEFDNAYTYFKERLVIAHFMEREFFIGLKVFVDQWGTSTVNGRIKMMVWFMLMIMMSKKTFFSLRFYIVRHTPFKWGGWKQFTTWKPSNEIIELLEST